MLIARPVNSGVRWLALWAADDFKMNERIKYLYSDGKRYDLVMGKFATGNLLEFYRHFISRYRGPVLDIACGTGRLTIPLAEGDVDVTGMDISEQMLKLAEIKASERGVSVPFIRGDARNFNLHKKFGFIFIAAQSLSHLHTRDDIEACFMRVRQHLTEDGRLLIELHNPSLTLLSRDPSRRYIVGEYEDGNGRLILSEQVSYDAATQVNHIVWHFCSEAATEEVILSFEMRQFFPQEIDELLTYNGFTIEQKYGGYDEAVFSGTSPKQLIVCYAS
jgi:SAM-dependent methyltransferase